ncbi:MAG: radical SAM protein [Methanomicrobiales archaeon]|nr:radical SAM protein [Methanomicrobiales archaeon]MDD1669266.1 radical SAM protein [Methanomicrobiales archaeon]
MRIAEIFRSIQGEGLSQGLITTFVRLSGCNLDCSWCDTPYARDGGKEVPLGDVFQAVEFSSCGRVCITGGEPLLQLDEVTSLARRIDEAGYEVEIETNGTIDFSPLQPYASICMDVKCPSSGEKSDLSLLSRIRAGDAVKFVVSGTEDLDYAREVIATHRIPGEYLVSPVFGSDSGALAREVLERNMPVRFQVQLHRILGVR